MPAPQSYSQAGSLRYKIPSADFAAGVEHFGTGFGRDDHLAVFLARFPLAQIDEALFGLGAVSVGSGTACTTPAPTSTCAFRPRLARTFSITACVTSSGALVLPTSSDCSRAQLRSSISRSRSAS